MLFRSKVKIALVRGEVSLGIDGRRGARAGLPPFLPLSFSPWSSSSGSSSGSGSPPVLRGGGGGWLFPPLSTPLPLSLLGVDADCFSIPSGGIEGFRCRPRLEGPGLPSPNSVGGIE